ncbi:hypothetical protein [Isoptericola rhizosphaerae]|uniref:hypothetical protein n=1 Tax=Isoptericola rhizosphaerae TaxID=3377837 RepID=UPI00383B267A
MGEVRDCFARERPIHAPREEWTMKTRYAGPVTLMILTISACSMDDGVGVATIESSPFPVDGYINAATADYADCLDEAGFAVEAVDGGSETSVHVGYAQVEGSSFLPNDGDGYVVDREDTSAFAIGVDGVDRDEEIRRCYGAFPGAKDALIDSFDDPGFVADEEGTGIAPEEVEASIEWLRCARDAGVTVIEDPDPAGYIIIPQELELAEAAMLGQECSAPMAHEEHWPLFQFMAGVEDPSNGMMAMDPYIDAIDGPFYEAMCERNPDECSGAE